MLVFSPAVAPGGKMDLAMQLIFTPMLWRLKDRKRQAEAV